MVNREKVDELLKNIRGKVLNEMVIVEVDLTGILDDFFFREKNNEKSVIFYWEILNPMRLSDKIDLFKKIRSFKKWKNYREILNSLISVNKFRNRLAHGLASYNKCREIKLVIYDPITLKEVIIDKKMLENFDKAIYYIHRYMCKNCDVEEPSLKDILK
ncbi:MAG: hypothetical protein PHH54_03385 [Candidatus Nanoarchaeia archaeon]|nr:hypothetical protein [Candidatus Nanoarchaeia archaeon]MDD5741000.1 hypothetical protein [Candidatus Nanoarchaeia archaeon]